MTGQRSKVILSNYWTKEFLSIMDVIKEFIVKGYVNATFDTIRMTMSSKPDSYSGVVIWNCSKWSMVDSSTV